jgi:outer membrane biosynthesis protein TonB
VRAAPHHAPACGGPPALPRVKSFWRNVILIALAHIALVAGLIRWSVAAKTPSNPESIVWLGGAGDLSAGEEREKEESSSSNQPATEPESTKSEQVEAADEKPVPTNAKSEIELPSATPKPTPTATPAKPSPTPVSKPTTTPKPARNATRSVAGGPTPGKAVLAKASRKTEAKHKARLVKAGTKSEEKEKIVLAKKDSAPQNGSAQAKPGSASGLSGVASKVGGNSASEFGWYGEMLHDRFYRAWIQPTANVATGTKISTLVKLRIEKDGRVSKFEIIKASENAAVNESVRVVAKQVTQVDAPPTGLTKGDHYDVNINFELNTEER